MEEARCRKIKFADKKRKAKVKEVNLGDDAMVNQIKSSVKTPCDLVPYKAVQGDYAERRSHERNSKN